MEGSIGEGRFFIKRNRGKQEGYYVIAPFIINSYNNDVYIDENSYKVHTANRKFLINLGWIPRSRKYLVYNSIGDDAFGEETSDSRI